MSEYSVSTTYFDKEKLKYQLLGMVKDCVPEYFGDNSGVVDADSLWNWLITYAEYPIFVYADNELACCSYLCGADPGFKAAIHCFTHPKYRSPQHMLTMSRMGMDLYFKKLGLLKLEGVVPEYDRAARLFDLRIGMKKDGRFRNHFLYKGKWYDAVFYSILRSEFYE